MSYAHDFSLYFTVESDNPDVNSLTAEEIFDAFRDRIGYCLTLDDFGYETSFNYETGDYFKSTEK